jgi:hypothetical protein
MHSQTVTLFSDGTHLAFLPHSQTSGLRMGAMVVVTVSLVEISGAMFPNKKRHISLYTNQALFLVIHNTCNNSTKLKVTTSYLFDDI